MPNNLILNPGRATWWWDRPFRGQPDADYESALRTQQMRTLWRKDEQEVGRLKTCVDSGMLRLYLPMRRAH